MYSFGTMKSQTPQVASARQTSQVAHHLSQGSSAVWSANTMQQCMVNSGVHGLHGTNFTLQNGTSQSRNMTRLQNPDPTSYKGNSEVQVSQSTNLAFQNEANHNRQSNRLQSSDPSHYMGNSGVQPSQSTHFALQKGANNNRQMKSLRSSDTPQYMGNSGVKVSRSSYFTSQNGGNDSRPIMSLQSSDSSDIPSQFKEASQQIDHILLKMILSQPQYTVNKFQDGSVSVPTTCIPGSATMQNPLHYSSNQSLHSPVDTNDTYRNPNTANFCNRPVYFEAERNRTRNASLLEQHRAQQAMHGTPNGEMTKAISSYTSTTLIAYEEMVNTNIPGSAASSNNQAQGGPTQIHRQSFSTGGYSQNVSPSCQSFGNNSVGTQRMSSNPQGMSVSNMGKISRQPSNRCSPSYNNYGGFRSINSLNQCEIKSFQSKRIKCSLSPDTTPQQMHRQNIHAESTNQSYASKPNPPYWSHVSPTTNKNVKTKNVAPSEMYSLNASKSLPLHSRLPVPQSVMPTNQKNGNAQFQHNTLPNAMISSNERNNSEGGQVIPSNVVPECERVIWQRKDGPAMVVSHSNNSGMPSPFKQNDSCASSMSGHPGTKAIAVVPPLSQEEYHSPTSSETCKSVDDAQKSCISTDLSTINETTFGRGEPNQNQVTPKKANANEALLTISDSETESLAETLIQNDNEPIVQKVSEVSVSVTSSGEHTEGTLPQLPNFNELSLLPAKSWTAEALTKLILEMDEAQPKPINNLKCSSIIKIMMIPWNKNCEVITNYNKDCQKCLLSEVEEFCETHIKQGTVVLKQVTPDFQDQLKRYIILKDDEMPSEPPYKSLWLNVNDQLDDIDKEFGFPLALKRHIVVEETESQGHNFEVIDNIPEPTVDEAVNKGLYPAKSESVGMEKESQISQSPPASSQESSDKSVGESSYSFKIEVLPPEEAKLIFEQVNPKNQKSSSCEKETVTGSGKWDGIEDMGPTLNNLKVKKSLDNQLKEICCLTRFVEINAGVKLSSKCKCGSKKKANESTTNTLKLDPDFCQEDVNFPLSNIKPSSHLSHIIDLTDDDDQLLSLFDNEPEPIVQTCSQSNAVVCELKDKEISSEFSLQDLQSFVIKKRETGIEHVQEDVLKEPVQSSNSASCTQLSTEDSDNTRTKEPHLLSNLEKEEDAPVTSHGNVRSPSENQTKLEVSDVDKRMLNISVCKAPDDKTKGKRQKKKRQRSLEHYFHSLKKPKICRLPVASDSNPTSEAQNLFYKEKTLALVLFGQQEASSSKKDKCLVSSPITASYEKHKPPGVLSVKLDSSGRDITTANTTKDCSVKQKIYEKWRRSVPTINSSVATHSKKKMRRRRSLPASLSIERTEEKKTVSPELRLSDRTRKYILSLKKRRALTECRRREEIKRSYSVTIEKPEHQQGREMDEEGNGMVNRDGIVLKFSVLPNTFNFAAGSSEREKAESISDSLKPVEKVHQEPAKKLKVRTWYSSEAMQYRPLCVPKNPGLFDEYRKKYKEKTLTSTDE
ncbi:uncharacterized protein si:ch211-106e7.2 [Cyprinodon tularosa]|uniref:uncharacterized protein si:ch211-106e7.2 n=1 Tax=Cyprinodon tularosa TaxID=77115 RepID=UPI0018E28106|nr:uncharacterized protein si:ch211-106e7.2 [Cyprinodon tularosa]